MTNMKKFVALQKSSGVGSTFFEDRYQHCVQRMEERFNVPLSYDEWQELNFRVFMEDGATYLDMGEQANSGLYVIDIQGVKRTVAYSETAFCIMTIFPRNDLRLFHSQNGTYTPKAKVDADFRYRDERRALAERFHDLEENEYGRFVTPKVQQAKPEPEAKPANVFAEALAGFKPATRPILTVAKAKPEPAQEPAAVEVPELSSEVVALYAQLDSRYKAQRASLSAAEERALAEITDLEDRIERLRGGEEGRRMAGEFVRMGHDMAVQAFEKFRDGILDEASAVAMAHLLLGREVVADSDAGLRLVASSGRNG